LTSLDRITAAFEGEPVDRPPIFHAGWSSWAASIVLGRECEDALDAANECGRIIVGISNYSVPGSPPANIEAMLEILRLNR
jgi:hypothetical protein